MNIALHRRTSLAEFLAWEERQELRYGFDGFEPDAMVGGIAAHVCSSVPPKAKVVSHPVVILEVLSEGIAQVDHVTRNAEYRATASVEPHIMLEQDSQAATVLAR